MPVNETNELLLGLLARSIRWDCWRFAFTSCVGYGNSWGATGNVTGSTCSVYTREITMIADAGVTFSTD